MCFNNRFYIMVFFCLLILYQNALKWRYNFVRIEFRIECMMNPPLLVPNSKSVKSDFQLNSDSISVGLITIMCWLLYVRYSDNPISKTKMK